MFTATYTIRLHDTDAAGVIYFAAVLRIAHDVYEQFLEAHGESIRATLDGRTLAYPVVHAEADYRRPIRLGDRLSIRLDATRAGEGSFTTRYTFSNGQGEIAAEASLVHAAVDVTSGRPVPLPDAMVRIIIDGHSAS